MQKKFLEIQNFNFREKMGMALPHPSGLPNMSKKRFKIIFHVGS